MDESKGRNEQPFLSHPFTLEHIRWWRLWEHHTGIVNVGNNTEIDNLRHCGMSSPKRVDYSEWLLVPHKKLGKAQERGQNYRSKQGMQSYLNEDSMAYEP